MPEDVALFDLHAETTFRDAVAQHLGVRPDMVRPTAGTSAANTAVVAHAVRHGAKVLSERPTYAPLWQAAEGLGGVVKFVDRDAEGRLDAGAMADRIDDDTCLVLLTSPNNPSGDVVDTDGVHRIADAAAAHGALVLVDQVYRELTDHDVLGATHPAVVSTGSLNKCWGAPGLRAGWAVGDARVMADIEEVHRILSLGPSSPGTRLGTILLGLRDERWGQKLQRLAATHPIYEQWAAAHGLDPAHGELTAFPHVGGDTRALAARALQDGILLLPGDVFGRPGHVRIGLGVAPEPLQAALDALSPLLRGHRA